jgi:CRP-like cAMP-binding protein
VAASHARVVLGDQLARLEDARGRAHLPRVVLQIVAEGITQAQIAKVLGTSQASLSRLLSAVRRPHRDHPGGATGHVGAEW